MCLNLNKPTADLKLLQDYLSFVGTMIPHDSRHASLTSSRMRALALRGGMRPSHRDTPLVPIETYERYKDKSMSCGGVRVGSILIQFSLQLRELLLLLKLSKQTYRYVQI